MALRDQPYIPLFVQDYLTDEKLKECCASSVGVYNYLMCVMHKSKEYGTVLLRQKNQQTSDQIENFAIKLQKHIPFSLTVIYDALTELIEEDVIQLDTSNNKIKQKRMIKDNDISLKRSKAGSKGGFATAKVPAKKVANSATANDYENEVKKINYKAECKLILSTISNHEKRLELPDEIQAVIKQMRGWSVVGEMTEKDLTFTYNRIRKELSLK